MTCLVTVTGMSHDLSSLGDMAEIFQNEHLL